LAYILVVIGFITSVGDFVLLFFLFLNQNCYFFEIQLLGSLQKESKHNKEEEDEESEDEEENEESSKSGNDDYDKVPLYPLLLCVKFTILELVK
jgi:flagellar biosynthesis component FlhA